MKIIDTTTFFEEKMMMEIRFNILDEFVDEFIVCEALFTHRGDRKKINFNPNDFPNFKNKINHIVLEKEPENIIKNIKDKNDFNIRLNSIKRIEAQRNFIYETIKNFSDEDWIIYSDNDEIPNLKTINFDKINNKILIFKQKMFYYKFNLKNSNVEWFGSKACKLKYLKSINWLRNIKNKKYQFYRLDTLFSKNKYTDIKIHDEGGWHFTNLKTAEELYKKFIHDENHYDFDKSKIDLEEIKKMIDDRIVKYDHTKDKNSKEKFSDKRLVVVDDLELPSFIKTNREKYYNWFIKN
tara:strand:+ start:341 stop:1225 length:885 start_codon:yes stop_codon:yes gene_type:complete